MLRKQIALCFATAVSFGAFLIGCAGVPSGGATATPAPVTTTSALQGNWLLYGAMPVQGTTSSPSPGFAMAMQVTGSQILATARIQGMCSATSSFGATYGNTLTGTIASDGSFTISSPAQSTATSLTVKGTVPSAAGAAWPGTYSFSFSAPIGSCNVTQAGAFTATPFAQLAGTFLGGATFYSSAAPQGQAVQASLTVQQNGNIVASGASTPSPLALAGTVSLTGFACFSNGSTSTTQTSLLDGNEAVLFFTMNDGSTLQLIGDLTDTTARTLQVRTLYVTSGSCAGLYTAPANPLLLSR